VRASVLAVTGGYARQSRASWSSWPWVRYPRRTARTSVETQAKNLRLRSRRDSTQSWRPVPHSLV